jgi:GrpB-like predicted nucleotidyltransferase (UPF0157 family)
LIPHDTDWKKSFVLLRSILLAQLSATHLDIQHVGSTAIPEVPAKPILEFDMLLNILNSFLRWKQHLERWGMYRGATRGFPAGTLFDSQVLPFHVPVPFNPG